MADKRNNARALSSTDVSPQDIQLTLMHDFCWERAELRRYVGTRSPAFPLGCDFANTPLPLDVLRSIVRRLPCNAELALSQTCKAFLWRVCSRREQLFISRLACCNLILSRQLFSSDCNITAEKRYTDVMTIDSIDATNFTNSKTCATLLFHILHYGYGRWWLPKNLPLLISPFKYDHDKLAETTKSVIVRLLFAPPGIPVRPFDFLKNANTWCLDSTSQVRISGHYFRAGQVLFDLAQEPAIRCFHPIVAQFFTRLDNPYDIQPETYSDLQSMRFHIPLGANYSDGKCRVLVAQRVLPSMELNRLLIWQQQNRAKRSATANDVIDLLEEQPSIVGRKRKAPPPATTVDLAADDISSSSSSA